MADEVWRRKVFTYRSLSLESRRCSSEQRDDWQNERTEGSQQHQGPDRGADHQESDLHNISLCGCLIYHLTVYSQMTEAMPTVLVA